MNRVIGQTGRKGAVLSDGIVQYKKSKSRTARYWYMKIGRGWLCQINGPFHSALYGACSFGTTRRSAKKALVYRLANDYGYLGCLLFSDVDTADKVGIVDYRLVIDNMKARPITIGDLCDITL